MMQNCYLRLVLTPNIYTTFNNLPIKIHKIIEWKTFFFISDHGAKLAIVRYLLLIGSIIEGKLFMKVLRASSYELFRKIVKYDPQLAHSGDLMVEETEQSLKFPMTGQWT